MGLELYENYGRDIKAWLCVSTAPDLVCGDQPVSKTLLILTHLLGRGLLAIIVILPAQLHLAKITQIKRPRRRITKGEMIRMVVMIISTILKVEHLLPR